MRCYQSVLLTMDEIWTTDHWYHYDRSTKRTYHNQQLGRLHFRTMGDLKPHLHLSKSFKNMGQSRPLFRLFSYFSHSNINDNFNNTSWNKRRWCACDSNLGPQVRLGADKTTELWRPPHLSNTYRFMCHVLPVSFLFYLWRSYYCYYSSRLWRMTSNMNPLQARLCSKQFNWAGSLLFSTYIWLPATNTLPTGILLVHLLSHLRVPL